MCRWCNSSVSPVVNTTRLMQNKISLTSMMFCQDVFTLNRHQNIYKLLLVLPVHIWMIIIQYCDQYKLPYLLMQCNRSLYHVFSTQEFYHNLYSCFMQQLRFLQPYEDVLEDNVNLVMPNTLCPDNYYELYKMAALKVKWLKKMNVNVQEIIKFIPLYKRIGNPNFGIARNFAVNDVYIILSPHVLPYEVIEVSSVRPSKSNRIHIRNNVVLSLFELNESNTVGAAIYLMDELSSNHFISYSDIGAVICHLEIFAKSCNDGVCISCLSVKNTPEFEMPFEVYYCF